ncbi:MAG: ankyrin repeat domain-containing protein [Candidatus Riflebacteria bacterium]|nr:ankyrin repeat domain-containing protein [Candidatus Riflebacteria bacterium]
MRAIIDYLFGFLFSKPDLIKMFTREGSQPTLEQVRAAIKRGAPVKARAPDTRTVLMLAAVRTQDPEVILELIRAGAKPNERRYGVNGYIDTDSDSPPTHSSPTTALMMAAESNPNPEILNALLEGGADPRIGNADDWTAFSFISRNAKLKGTAVYEILRKAHENRKPADFICSSVAI